MTGRGIGDMQIGLAVRPSPAAVTKTALLITDSVPGESILTPPQYGVVEAASPLVSPP